MATPRLCDSVRIHGISHPPGECNWRCNDGEWRGLMAEIDKIRLKPKISPTHVSSFPPYSKIRGEYPFPRYFSKMKHDCYLSNFKYFTQLPLEIRMLIYWAIIDDLTVFQTRRPRYGTIEWSYPRTPSVTITATEVTFRNLQFQNLIPLLCTSKQVYQEMNQLIYSRVHHVIIAGDLLLGLADTSGIFDVLKRRPLLAQNVRTIDIELTLPEGCANPSYGSWIAKRGSWLSWALPRIGPGSVIYRYIGASPAYLIVANHRDIWAPLWSPVVTVASRLSQIAFPAKQSEVKNTLRVLAKMLAAFEGLETIDLETRNRNLVFLFPPPSEIAKSFQLVVERDVKVNLLLTGPQVGRMAKVIEGGKRGADTVKFLYKHGEQIQEYYGGGYGPGTFDGTVLSYGIFRCNVLDCTQREGIVADETSQC